MKYTQEQKDYLKKTGKNRLPAHPKTKHETIQIPTRRD